MELRSDRKVSTSRRSTQVEREKAFNNEILFMCPELEDGVYPKNVWKEKVIAYIAGKKALDRVRACIVAIKTFNSESEICYSLKVLRTYASNLINYPSEGKYRKIRSGNPCIQKLKDIVGAINFLEAIGFEEKSFAVKNENTVKKEMYFVHMPNKKLKMSKVLEELDSVSGFTLSLFRNVIFIAPHTDPVPEEPDDFYEWTIEDMEREYQYRKNKSESNQQLRTRKMREEAVKSDSDYTIIRVKLPDEILIQATFSTKEKLADLKTLLKKNMEFSRSFFFVLPPSKKFAEVEEIKTFLDLGLFPSVTLLIRWQPDRRDIDQFRME